MAVEYENNCSPERLKELEALWDDAMEQIAESKPQVTRLSAPEEPCSVVMACGLAQKGSA